MENKIHQLKCQIDKERRLKQLSNTELLTELDKTKSLYQKLLGSFSKTESPKEKTKRDLELNNLLNRHNGNEVISRLILKLKVNNLHNYNLIEDLYKKYKDLQEKTSTSKVIDVLPSSSTLTIDDYIINLEKSEELKKKKKNRRIGFISKKGMSWWFVDNVTGDQYKITDTIPDYWEEEDVVKVAIDGEKVILLYVYQTTEERDDILQKPVISNSNSNKNKSDVEQVKEDIPESLLKEFEGKKIVIVTAEGGNGYVDYLRKYCKDVSWINPFEKSMERVKSEMQRSDVSIVCKNAIPHAVSYFMRDYPNPKYQLMNSPSKEKVFARIRFTLLHAE